jgi:hypothetical protein
VPQAEGGGNRNSLEITHYSVKAKCLKYPVLPFLKVPELEVKNYKKRVV